jgi:6-pyruvoyl-tetrahydropterin synthase
VRDHATGAYLKHFLVWQAGTQKETAFLDFSHIIWISNSGFESMPIHICCCDRIKEWLMAMLEESGWKEQLSKDCLQYAQTHASASSTSISKKNDEAPSSPFNDISLDAMIGALLTKSKGMFGFLD